MGTMTEVGPTREDELASRPGTDAYEVACQYEKEDTCDERKERSVVFANLALGQILDERVDPFGNRLTGTAGTIFDQGGFTEAANKRMPPMQIQERASVST